MESHAVLKISVHVLAEVYLLAWKKITILITVKTEKADYKIV